MLFQVQDRGKIQGAADAPAKDRRAQIVVDEHGEDVVQIVSANSGQVLKTFQVLEDIPPDGPCVSVLQIDWPRTDTITAECHQNPTDSLYVEIDPETLKTKRAMMNYAGFAASSPDHSKVAAFGPVPHFATEDQQSKYIVVDNSVIYPLPAASAPNLSRLWRSTRRAEVAIRWSSRPAQYPQLRAYMISAHSSGLQTPRALPSSTQLSI